MTAKNASLAQGQSLPSHPRLRLASRWCSLTRMPACFCTRFPFIPCWPLLVSQLFLANPPPSPPTHTKALPVRNVERPRGGELAAAFRVDFARGQAAFGRTKAFSLLGRLAAAGPRAQHPAPPPAPPAAGPDPARPPNCDRKQAGRTDAARSTAGLREMPAARAQRKYKISRANARPQPAAGNPGGGCGGLSGPTGWPCWSEEDPLGGHAPPAGPRQANAASGRGECGFKHVEWSAGGRPGADPAARAGAAAGGAGGGRQSRLSFRRIRRRGLRARTGERGG